MSDRVFDDVPKWRLWWWDLQFYFELWQWKLFGGWYQIYIDLFWLHYYGFYPRAIVFSCWFETTFLFDTKQEADQAFQKCEREKGRAIGWYYEMDEFKNYVDKDENYNYNDLNIWWIYGLVKST